MNSCLPVTPPLVHSALDGLKQRNSGHKSITNYFLQQLDGVANLRMLESEKSLCFLHDEWDCSRLYFYTFDAADLVQMLRKINWPPIVVTDWIAKGDTSTVDKFLLNLGFHLHATYDRIVCKRIRREKPNERMCFACEKDREAIHALLFRVFDKYADHIMPINELGKLIQNKEVILSRDEQGQINGLVIVPVTGQVCHFNFLYNKGGVLALPQLLGNFYGLLTERGVQSGFGWVRRSRPLVLRLHESFGWKKDGLVDYIYLR